MAVKQYRLIAAGVHSYRGCTPDGSRSIMYRQATTGHVFYSRRDMTQFGRGTRFELVTDEPEPKRDDWPAIRALSFSDAKKLTGIKAGGWNELEIEWRAAQR